MKKKKSKKTKKTTKKSTAKTKTKKKAARKSPAKKKRNEMVAATDETMEIMDMQEKMEMDIPEEADEMHGIREDEHEPEPDPEMNFHIEDHPLDLHDDEMDEEDHF